MAEIAVEVACALPERQRCVRLITAAGTTARAALGESGLQAEFAQIDMTSCALGVWGRVVEDDYALADGDRLEVYRPLAMDPREARRLQVALGGTMAAVSRVPRGRRDR